MKNDELDIEDECVGIIFPVFFATSPKTVREFVKNNPTVYLSTHTPLGHENLENKNVIDLENPPESIYP